MASTSAQIQAQAGEELRKTTDYVLEHGREQRERDREATEAALQKREAEFRRLTEPIGKNLERIEKEAIHREIPPLCVGDCITKRHPFRMASILVIRLRPESGDLKLMCAFDHDDDAKLPAYSDAAFEQFLDLIGQGVGGDIVIPRLAA